MSNTNDPIVQTNTCAISGNEFSITQWDLDFYNKISPTFAGQKFQIPTPTLSPDERQKRRLAFRNERNLYRRTCDASGKQIISIYSPDKPYKVYDQKIWWSDSRDGLDYGRAFDFGKSFTEQFGELMSEVPHLPLINDDGRASTNCAFTNDFALWKNCYMCFHMWDGENDMYCYFCNWSNNLFDCNIVTWWASYSYECIIWSNLYNCKYLIKSLDCSDCSYWVLLQWCTFCFGCVWLTNASYCIQNKQYSKEEYFAKVKELESRAYMEKFFATSAVKEAISRPFIMNSENSSWDNLINCQNSIWTNLFNCQWVKFTDGSDRLVNCHDLFSVWKSELCYYWITPDNGYQVHFSVYSWHCKNAFYTMNCHNSSDLFGCIWLRNKQYCIFNKQYTKEQYEKTVAQIITHMQETWEWGEFFDPSLSPFWYNETVAQEYYPSTKTEITQNGYKRSDYEVPTPVSDKVIQGQDLPESVEEVQDDILHFAIACEVTGKLFRLQPQELVFYRKHNIPVPRKHPDQRHLERLALRK